MKKLYIIHFIVFLLVCVTACDDFGDINVDPDSPTETNPDYLFTQLIRGFDYSGGINLYLNNPHILPVTRLAMRSQTDSDLDQFTSQDSWEKYYGKIRNINELRKLIKKSTNDPERHRNQLAMIEIYEIFFAFKLTDKFGDVPFFDSGKGLSDLKFRPKYDAQGEIYKALLERLKKATNSIVVKTNTEKGEAYLDFIANKLVFPKGKPKDHFESWKKFGSSLLLKHALRFSKFNEQLAKEYIQDAFKNPLMVKVDDGVQILQTDLAADATTQSWSWARYYGPYSQPAQFLASKLTDAADISFVKNNEIIDPRFKAIYYPNKDGEYKILPNSMDKVADIKDVNLSRDQLYPGLERPKELTNRKDKSKYKATHAIWNRMYTTSFFMPIQLLTYSEHCLILAEIYAAGLAPGNAEDLYNKGIKASVKELLNVKYSHYPQQNGDAIVKTTDAEIDALLNHRKIKFNVGNALELIRTQRWIDYLFRPEEAWAVIRRTNLFDLDNTVPLSNNNVPFNMTYRIQYPSEEKEFNTSNYLDQIAKMGSKDDMRYKPDLFK